MYQLGSFFYHIDQFKIFLILITTSCGYLQSLSLASFVFLAIAFSGTTVVRCNGDTSLYHNVTVNLKNQLDSDILLDVSCSSRALQDYRGARRLHRDGVYTMVIPPPPDPSNCTYECKFAAIGFPLSYAVVYPVLSGACICNPMHDCPLWTISRAGFFCAGTKVGDWWW